MIDIENLSKRYGTQQVLNQVSLKINKGEMFGLLGPSGSGKTTLIRLITGAEKKESGGVKIEGKEVPNFETIRRIGFMPQNDALYTDISGYDNLCFFGGIFGLKRDRLAQAVKQVLKLVELENDAKKLVHNYSGGMKKRLSLAAALIHSPDLLLLDEPTVGIDPLLRKKIWNEFKRQKEMGKTLIVTTHVMDEIKYCDRAGILYNGKVLACGTIEELKKLGKGEIENLFFDTTLVLNGAQP